MLDEWNLPAPIRKGAAAHHSPEEADEGRLHLSHIVQTADRYINEIGLGTAPYSRKPTEEAEHTLRDFGLFDNVERVAEDFKTEFEVLRAVL